MKAVILAGGLGTRISEETHLKPKPLIEIGGRPILWHLMKIFTSHGVNDFIICLEDGKKLKMLKRHLMTHYQLTPDAYRAKWKLPADYPMVAPNYAEQRRSLAKKIGLGRKGRGTAPLPEPATPAPKRRGRKPKATAS